jgi:hypothetical protein
MYKTRILQFFGSETSSPSLREGFEKMTLRRTFGPRRGCQEAGEICTMRSFITCTVH